MFYTYAKMQKRKILTGILMFAVSSGILFSQEEPQSGGNTGSQLVPQELLRPRREEALRYPVDMVIGPMGAGEVSQETYQVARGIAAALLAGNIDAPALSTMSRVFLEGYISALSAVSPRSFRIGGGQVSPDGSFSFLVRFIGRDQGITGELYIRREERPGSSPAQTAPVPAPPPAIEEPVTEDESAGSQNADLQVENPAPVSEEPAMEDESTDPQSIEPETREAEPQAESQPVPAQAPAPVPGRAIWIFDDLILEEPRTREEENMEKSQPSGFSTYQRMF